MRCLLVQTKRTTAHILAIIISSRSFESQSATWCRRAFQYTCCLICTLPTQHLPYSSRRWWWWWRQQRGESCLGCGHRNALSTPALYLVNRHQISACRLLFCRVYNDSLGCKHCRAKAILLHLLILNWLTVVWRAWHIACRGDMHWLEMHASWSWALPSSVQFRAVVWCFSIAARQTDRQTSWTCTRPKPVVWWYVGNCCSFFGSGFVTLGPSHCA